MTLSTQDQARIGAAITAAEEKTAAELVCVLARSSSSYGTMPLVWSLLPAFVLPWVLVAVTHWPVERILLAQLAVFALLLMLLSAPSIRTALVPRAMQRSHAHRAAMEQFMIRGLARKPERTGVLIFVSQAERYARIVADDGVASLVKQQEWQTAVDTLIAHMKKDEIADGFVSAIDQCSALLEKAVPPREGTRDVFPNRIYVID